MVIYSNKSYKNVTLPPAMWKYLFIVKNNKTMMVKPCSSNATQHVTCFTQHICFPVFLGKFVYFDARF